jgi:hypothetical protein
VVSTEARVRIKRSQMCQASAVPTPIGCRRASSVPIRMLCRINVFMSVCVQCPFRHSLHHLLLRVWST